MTERALDLEPPSAAVAAVPDTALRCTRCLYHSGTPSIVFDEAGVCNYCKLHDQLDAEYPIGDAGAKILEGLADQIRAEGKGKKFDVVVGVSGGCDSSYLVYKAKELGLRPLAAHFDNTWNSKIAVENIHNVLRSLDVELYTHVIDNEECNDLYRSFLLAGVAEMDAVTDIGLATTLYRAAEKYGIRYIFEGHTFRTEGVSPLGWAYVDGKYIQTVHKKFGTGPMKTFPNLWLSTFLKFTLIRKVKRIRPLYYMDYHKEEVKKLLIEKFGWQWYGGHHLENRISNFAHTYLYPRRFGIDQRANGFSAMVRSGQMSREEGLELLAVPPVCDAETVALVKKRLGFSDAEFEHVMTMPILTFRDYKTYKQTFERLRPLFYLLYKMDLVPKSFYVKYTSK